MQNPKKYAVGLLNTANLEVAKVVNTNWQKGAGMTDLMPSIVQVVKQTTMGKMSVVSFGY
jgi:hypothetical protein